MKVFIGEETGRTSRGKFRGETPVGLELGEQDPPRSRRLVSTCCENPRRGWFDHRTLAR